MQLKKNINLGKIKIFKFIYLVIFVLLFGIRSSLSNEDFVSDVMGDAGQAVVDNGANIESLKSNSKGIASFVKSIKETIRSNEDGDISTILIEIHKTKKAIKETIKTIRDAGGNFDSDLETDVTNKKGTLDFDNYTNPIYTPPKVFVHKVSPLSSVFIR